MKQILFWLIFPVVTFAQYNWVKNGDFKETEYSYLRRSKITRLDIKFAAPKHWLGIKESFISSVASDVDFDTIPLRNTWDRILAKEICNKLDSPVVSVSISWARRTQKQPFSRIYLIGQLYCPLKENHQYCIKVKVVVPYHQDYLCLGQDSLGIYFGNESEIDFFNHHDFSPRYSSNTINIALPSDTNEWEEISTVFTAKGGESKLMIGCFVEEDKLKLYQKKRNKNRPCPEGVVQAVNIAYLSLTPLDADEFCPCQESKTPEKQQEFQKE